MRNDEKNFFSFFCKKQKCKVGGLDLSRRDLDAKKSKSRQSRFSRQVLKTGLDAMDVLDSSKPSLDSLDYSKNWDFLIFVEISISTPKKSQSRPSRKSWQVLKTGHDVMDVLDLDLDWSLRRDPQAYKNVKKNDDWWAKVFQGSRQRRMLSK